MSVWLSVGPASKIPKLIHYRVVLFHTPNSGLIDLWLCPLNLVCYFFLSDDGSALPLPPPPPTYTPPGLSLLWSAPLSITTRLWRKISLALREIFSLCSHIVLPSLLPRSSLVVPIHIVSDAPYVWTWQVRHTILDAIFNWDWVGS